jgi:protein-tyrosine phosphatase
MAGAGLEFAGCLDCLGSLPHLAARLHKIRNEGGSILLHCRGGQGRSGMIALRILVERGEEVSVALTRLRSERPGAVETEAQLIWASEA